MFEQLDPSERSALIAAAKGAAEVTWTSKINMEKLDLLRQKGMQVVETFDRRAFVEAMKPLEPEFEKRFGKEALAAIRSTP